VYIEQFKLRDLPFRLSPDPQFLFLSKSHARAKAYMESTIWFTDGFVVITGEIGSGKTTLIETFLRELEKDVVVAQINQTQVSAVEFLQAVLVQFGFTPFKMKKAELLATLNDFLVEQYAAGRKVLLIVDEAQNLNMRVLEEVRLLSGVETTQDKVLRIILAGQPELNDKIDSPELVQLAQRVRLRFHLTALSADDMKAYVLHRLEVAGSGGRAIFADGIWPLLYRYTGGVPRLINTLCETAMMAAYSGDRDQVLAEDIESAIEELRWPEYAARRPKAKARIAQEDAPADDAPAVGAPIAPVRIADTPLAAASPSAVAVARPEQAGPGLYIGAGETGSARQHPDAPLARLMVSTAGRTMGELPLHVGRLVIGRTSDNDLQIDSRFVSRHHCQIVTKTGSCVIEDLNSTNGIVVKSKRVRSHNLNDGDVVTIGKYDLLYVDERTRVSSGDTGQHTVSTGMYQQAPAADDASSEDDAAPEDDAELEDDVESESDDR
jgi:type II secretory pathway predicted ATPase ExeA